MNMAADNREIARQVVEAIGGRENIASFAHCATRLRIMVHDQKKIDQKKVEQIDKVKASLLQLRAIPDHFRNRNRQSDF